MRSIREIDLKIKVLGQVVLGEAGLFIIVLLAITAAFGIGRLSVLKAPESPILAQNGAATAIRTAYEDLPIKGSYLGSKNGHFYYFPWCTDAAKIPPELRRWFADEKSAQKAGYEPATNCKGMGSK